MATAGLLQLRVLGFGLLLKNRRTFFAYCGSRPGAEGRLHCMHTMRGRTASAKTKKMRVKSTPEMRSSSCLRHFASAFSPSS